MGEKGAGGSGAESGIEFPSGRKIQGKSARGQNRGTV